MTHWNQFSVRKRLRIKREIILVVQPDLLESHGPYDLVYDVFVKDTTPRLRLLRSCKTFGPSSPSTELSHPNFPSTHWIPDLFVLPYNRFFENSPTFTKRRGEVIGDVVKEERLVEGVYVDRDRTTTVIDSENSLTPPTPESLGYSTSPVTVETGYVKGRRMFQGDNVPFPGDGTLGLRPFLLGGGRQGVLIRRRIYLHSGFTCKLSRTVRTVQTEGREVFRLKYGRRERSLVEETGGRDLSTTGTECEVPLLSSLVCPCVSRRVVV